MSNATFDVPQFQREYAWGSDEVTDFWTDLKNNITSESYFLGLVILTDGSDRKHVVDGQQRLITLTLLASALYHEARRHNRSALAGQIQSDFLRSIDYDTDETDPRLRLADDSDDQTLRRILDTGTAKVDKFDDESVSFRILQSFSYIQKELRKDLALDPFKRLGQWTDFITNRLYFAVFVHPEPSSAYQVYEVINTRGKDLTTADLLKNYVISQNAPSDREARYAQWQSLARQFPSDGTNNFVQYIRHAVTVRSGHILPKDLFAFLAKRLEFSGKSPPTPSELMDILEESLPAYLQMIDPSIAGPAERDNLGVFAALNSLGVIAVRPILLAISKFPDSVAGMEFVLKLVVRRIIVGNLGTGNVERRFGEAARKVTEAQDWHVIIQDLSDLNPSREEFVSQLKKRSFNKGVLSFIRRSIIQHTMTPATDGTLHFVWTRQTPEIGALSEEDGAFWGSTLGNTLISESERRPRGADDWEEFRQQIMPTLANGEITDVLNNLDEWDVAAVETIGKDLAEMAGDVWY